MLDDLSGALSSLVGASFWTALASIPTIIILRKINEDGSGLGVFGYLIIKLLKR